MVGGLLGLQRARCGGDYLPLELWGGLAAGLGFGTLLLRRGGSLVARGAGGALLLSLVALALVGWAAPLVACLGCLAGLILAREAGLGLLRTSIRPALVLGGAALGALVGAQPESGKVALAFLALGAAGALQFRHVTTESTPSAGPSLGVAMSAFRLACLWVVGAGGFRFLSDGWPAALGLAAAPLLGGLALAYLAGGWLKPRLASRLGGEALGWVGVWLVGGVAVGAVRDLGTPGLLPGLLFAGGLLAGPAFARRPQLEGNGEGPPAEEGLGAAPSLWWDLSLALFLAAALLGGSPGGTFVFNLALERATEVQRAALGLGRGDVGAEAFASAVKKGRISARIWGRRTFWPSTSCVVEANRDRRRLRLLSRAGLVRSALPDRRASEEHPEAAAVVAAALAAWTSPEGGLAQDGLGDGVLAAALGRRSGIPTPIYEVDPGLLSLHTHPARPFAFRSGDLESFRERLSPLPLAARPPAELVAYALAPQALPPEPFVAPLSVLPGAWLSALGEREVWAFVVGESLVLSTNLPSLAALEAGWAKDPDLAKALAEIGIRRPLELLSCLAANPLGLRALAAEQPSGLSDVHPKEVVRVGARTLASAPPDLGVGPRAAAAGAALAELLARRESPAALPFARAAVAELRSSTTLRTLGDVLHLEAARLGKAPSEDPVPLWEEALGRDPSDVGARLALAWYHYDRKDFAKVQKLLLPGVGRDAQRERELQYLLGLAAMGLQEAGPAQLHFQAARGFRNADDLSALARSMAETQRKQSPQPGPTPGEGPLAPEQPEGPPATPAPALSLPQAQNRIRAAELFWSHAQRQSGDAQLGSLLNAADTLTRAVSGSDQLSAKEQLKLAKLLRKVGGALEARRGVGLQAAALARAEAEVLLPLSQGSTRRAIDRARALLRGGQGAQAQAELEALIEGKGARLPAAHVALAELHLRGKRYEQAIKVYHQALAVSPNTSGTAKIYLALAGAYVLNQREDRARGVLEAAGRLYPDHPKIMLALAESYVRLGLTGDARRTLKAFLKSVPETHPDRRKAQAALDAL